MNVADALKFGGAELTAAGIAEPLREANSLLQFAIARDHAERQQADKRRVLSDRMTSLTIRERQVLEGVVEGLLNKQIANRLGIVEKTVKVHRAHAISKLGARSTAELVLATACSILSVRQIRALGTEAVVEPGS